MTTTVGAGLYLSPAEQDPLKQNAAIRQLMEGRSNAVGTFTLSANATSTSVTAINCSPSSVVIPVPMTTSTSGASASADLALMKITAGTGAFVVAHASNATSDRAFLYAVVG